LTEITPSSSWIVSTIIAVVGYRIVGGAGFRTAMLAMQPVEHAVTTCVQEALHELHII
jgi:hypothetical protein